jgi:hypothetical protein
VDNSLWRIAITTAANFNHNTTADDHIPALNNTNSAADIEQEPRTNQHPLISANTAHTDKEKINTDTAIRRPE